MICIYDKAATSTEFESNGLAVLNECLKATINHNLNGDYSLELEYVATSPKSKYLVELNIIKANGQLFRIHKVERSQKDGLKIIVWARHVFYDLAYFFIESAKVLNANMHEAMEMSIPPEAQDLFNIECRKANIAPFAVEHVNAVEAVFRLIEIYGGEIDRNNYAIAIKESLGTSQGITVRYGKNIKGITVLEDSAEVCTRIFPVGESGLLLPERYVEISGTKPLRFEMTKKVEFKTCKDVDSLRKVAQDYVKSVIKPKVHINLDFLELSQTNQYKEYKNLTNVEIGDLVDVYHEGVNLSTTLRVIRKQINLLNPINTKVELGDPKETIIDRLDNSSILDEITKMIQGNTSGLIIKKNTDILSAGTIKENMLVVGFSTKSDTNLTCTVTMTGQANEDLTLNILFYLDNLVYDLKPVQKLAGGSNVLSFILPMPQVQNGEHSFALEMWTSNGMFTIQKNNLQLSIEGLHIEGGLSATLPRIGVYFTYLSSMFFKKIKRFGQTQAAAFALIEDVPTNVFTNILQEEFIEKMLYPIVEQVFDISMDTLGILEKFSVTSESKYNYDDQWMVWGGDSEKLSNGTYEIFERITIKEPLFECIGILQGIDVGAMYVADLPDRAQYNELVTINSKLEKR